MEFALLFLLVLVLWTLLLSHRPGAQEMGQNFNQFLGNVRHCAAVSSYITQLPDCEMLGQLESLRGLEMKWATWNQASSRFWIINDNQWYSNQNKCSLESRLSLGVKIKTVDTIHFILLLEAAAALGRAAQKRSWISTITTSTSRDPTAIVYSTIGVQHSGPRLPSTGRNAKFRHQGAKQRPQRVWHGKWKVEVENK